MAADESLVFDVGLHKGEDTELYLRKGYRVVAFEADPRLARHCREVFAGPVAEGRLTIVEGAIAPAGSGEVVAFHRSSVSVWGTTQDGWLARNTWAGAEFETIAVPRVDMAVAFRRFGVPHYLKIDIEGADLVVLEGLATLPDRPAYVSLEASIDDAAEWDAQIRCLRDLGYARFAFVEQSRLPGRAVTTRDREGRAFEHVFGPDSSGSFGEDLPGPWLGFEQARRFHARRFHLLRLFGHRSPLRRIRGSYRALTLAERVLRQPIPGFSAWYDLHAARGP